MAENREILNEKANSFFEYLKNNDVLCDFREGITDNNKTKINLGTFGRIVLYFGKKGFTLTVNEIKDTDLAKRIQEYWLEFEQHTLQISKKQEANEKIPSIYVDGSYLSEKVGYAFVVIKDNNVLYEKNGNIDDPSILKYRQIGGEIQAVTSSLEWCKLNDISKVNIYYDYNGLEYWVTGEWKANKRITRKYRDTVKESKIKINWVKVDSHSNDRWNDYVDNLAKKGALSLIHNRNKNTTSDDSKKRLDDIAGKLNKFFRNMNLNPKCKKDGEYGIKFQITDEQGFKNIVSVYRNDKGKPFKINYQTDLSSKLKKEIEDIIFKRQTIKGKNVFAKFEYYYEILKKYRDCNFDFRILIEQINNVAKKKRISLIHSDSTFSEIESFYLKLKREYND